MECSLLLPDSLVLEIFLRLPHEAVLRAGLTCRQWLAVSRDEFLWRELFYHYYRIPRSVPRHPGESSHPYEVYHEAHSTEGQKLMFCLRLCSGGVMVQGVQASV